MMKAEHDELPLRSLPRDRASELFTARVMARVRQHDRRPDRRLRPVFAMGFAGAILIALAAGMLLRDRVIDSQPAPAVELARSLPDSALESLETGAAEAEPVIYVGSTDHYDFYIDMRQLEQSASGVRPASWRGELQPGL